MPVNVLTVSPSWIRILSNEVLDSSNVILPPKTGIFLIFGKSVKILQGDKHSYFAGCGKFGSYSLKHVVSRGHSVLMTQLNLLVVSNTVGCGLSTLSEPYKISLVNIISSGNLPLGIVL